MSSSRPPLARMATDLLTAKDVHVPPPSQIARARDIEVVACAIEQVARSRRRQRVGFAALALAAGFGIAFGWRAVRRAPLAAGPAEIGGIGRIGTVTAVGHVLAGSAVMLHAGREAPLDRGIELAAGDRVVAADGGRVAVSLSTGTHLVVESGGELTLVEQGPMQAFALGAGAVQADVAKLASGERFVIRTADAEVEVRGTSFRVAVVPPVPVCGHGVRTRVRVAEGIVVVRARGEEDRVAAGEDWPRGCGRGSSEAPRLPAPPSPAPSPLSGPYIAMEARKDPASVPAAPSNAAPPTVSSVPSPSELAEQNRIFGEANAARRRGDVATAITTFERLMTTYPSSPLAESASAERMRVIATTDPGRAAQAARAYLSRYPNGFAREEAKAILARSP